ncbi:hypothetical protein DF3PB_1090015 [uncultured Defluviicoccus sp.]|uniref:Uncharacterized protein n=1 Tax=metagenome TaxID=256318 RepID=A0A380T7Z1_9ZZZZ|nr:hypothetical protein DF3PB_1090015 [uncultured Defluviicoccus sp.]
MDAAPREEHVELVAPELPDHGFHGKYLTTEHTEYTEPESVHIFDFLCIPCVLWFLNLADFRRVIRDKNGLVSGQ